jgi:hypothetical protein
MVIQYGDVILDDIYIYIFIINAVMIYGDNNMGNNDIVLI